MNASEAHALATTREHQAELTARALTTFEENLAAAAKWRRRSWAAGHADTRAAHLRIAERTTAQALAGAALVLPRTPGDGTRVAVSIRRPEAGTTGVRITRWEADQ